MNLRETEPIRLWLYGLAGPLLAVLALYGLIGEASVGQWITLVGAVLGVAGGGEFARSQVDSPATEERKLAQARAEGAAS